MDEIKSEKFISEVVDLFKSAKKNLVTAVNMTMVYFFTKFFQKIQLGKQRFLNLINCQKQSKVENFI